MEIILAKYAGFCPGVKRAIRTAEEALAERVGPIYTIGPLIHNPQVVEGLRKRGLEVLPDDPSEWDNRNLEGAKVIIRSHGIPPRLVGILRKKGALVVDATCPTVKKAERAAMRLVGEGYRLFIIGDKDHPEVMAITGHVNEEAVVIKGVKEVKEWWEGQDRMVKKVGVIGQTTVDLFTFRSLVDGLINEIPEVFREVRELKIINTLCRNTLARQAEALHLAARSDLVVVVGGRNSSNTEFLRKICASTGKPTLKVEAAEELDPSDFHGVEKVAVLGGASTPREIMEMVRERLASF